MGWGQKSTVHFQQDPGLTGGFSRLLPALGSHPPLRLVRDRAPTGVRGPQRPVGDPPSVPGRTVGAGEAC